MEIELQVDLLSAIQMTMGAWQNVKVETVANCFVAAEAFGRL